MQIGRRKFLGGSIISLLSIPRLSGNSGELRCDVAVIGGGTGGFAAALAALRGGAKVVLTEETDWIGGQLTAQAVPPDEHPWIEQFGCTKSYRQYREGVRAYYRDHYPLTLSARSRTEFNPGNGGVSRLTHEFRVSVAVLEATLAPYLASGQLTLLLTHVPEFADISGDRVRSVTVVDLTLGAKRTISAAYFIDATELGELLPLTKAEFVTGAEAQSTTGEMHASSTAQPGNSQSFTFCFAMDYIEGEDHTIDKPADYSSWRDFVPKLLPRWPGKLFSWTTCGPKTLQPTAMTLVPNSRKENESHGYNLWVYRSIADRNNFEAGAYQSDITLINWPQNDYWLADLVTCPREKKEQLLRQGRQLSLSFLYWMQTDAPRLDGNLGWRGLRLRKDIVGTEDGLAKSVYVRESRRIEAEFTILEEHVGTQMRVDTLKIRPEEVTAERFPDSVGVGCYRIDLHPSAGGTNYLDVSSLPFQIPLGALIPKRMDNLLAASKNIGTTHITNGCYRLHPVEWNIGEAAGALAASAVRTKQSPRAIRNNQKLLKSFQSDILAQGFELEWPRIHPV